MFSKVKVVVSMCGDYVAFHETDIYISYIFGDYFYIEDDNIYEYLIDKLFLNWDDEDILEKQDKQELDKLVQIYMDDFEREYCDMRICDGVVEVDNNGNVLDIYYTL